PILEKAMQQQPAHEIRFALVSRAEGSLPPFAKGWRETLAAHAPMEAAAPTHREDIAFWLYSSGSTGRPKAVVHTHENPWWTAELYGKAVLGMSERDLC